MHWSTPLYSFQLEGRRVSASAVVLPQIKSGLCIPSCRFSTLHRYATQHHGTEELDSVKQIANIIVPVTPRKTEHIALN